MTLASTENDGPTGYAHPAYAESLSQFGVPRLLPESGGYVLERPIPGTQHRDAMGSYPLFVCRDWDRLHEDLENIGEDLVCLSLVGDPFGDYDTRYLRRYFDVVLPFKEHFVTNLSIPTDAIPSKHHRYYAKKALEKVRVEKCEDPARFLHEWTGLYANLARRHELTGIRAFSWDVFSRQLNTPGLVMFRAASEGETVGMHLWFVSGGVAYSHLAASSARGYELMAAYGLYRTAIEHFAGKVSWLNLGAGAGEETGGLSRFKKGWSTGTRTAYFCGKVLDPEKYDELAKKNGNPEVGYFPAYRTGEFE